MHRQMLLSVCKDFGYVYKCSCGQYHVHLKGVTIYLEDEAQFCRFLEMLEQACKSDNFADPNKSKLERSQLKIVKKYE
ncbi:MAG: hypothetical protein BA865_12425 [Desulfobacterales bacterium S5133MH4]|jgi:hypothetical protein|nr:MAG: hypothetical protein BA865_12425 [Desulfobacterales bacterium S5133MH4]